MKSRNQKSNDYYNKYKDIPIDLNERLNYMVDRYKVTSSQMDDIIYHRDMMIESLRYTDIKIILYEEPEGTPRHRYRIVNRYNYNKEAMTNPYVHVYSPRAKEDSIYMKRLVTYELDNLSYLIHTPCIVIYDTFRKTPSVYNRVDTFLAEIGLERPLYRPDWDNIGKKYSDMSNGNIWMDDDLVISGTVNKFYSILPRVEITIRYLNMLYNKHQYNSIIKKSSYDEQFNVQYYRK